MKQKAPTLRQFQNQFPTEESCLDHLMRTRYGDRHDCEGCGRNAHFYRIKDRRSYSCEYCGHQVYPTAGTPFERTRTSLRDWFYVMFLFTTTRNGVAAKRVEREIGVTYKTAWRMCDEIRKYMAIVDRNDSVGGDGIVEIDETLIGGKVRGGTKPGRHLEGKSVVLGMLERGGEVVTKIVADQKRATLIPEIVANVVPGATVHTDFLHSYRILGELGFKHDRVNHAAGEYVSATGCHTQTLDSFWNLLKNGIRGTYIHVSEKHLPKYLAEFEYRWNMRFAPHAMLSRLMTAFVR
jgi:transposase-like protein